MGFVRERALCDPAARGDLHGRLSGRFEIDFLTRRFVDDTPFGLDRKFAESAEGRDPLGASIAAFVAAARGEAARPLVTGEEAARALEVALEVDRKAIARPKLRLVRG